MKKYDEIITGLKNQKTNFNREIVWQRIQTSLSSPQAAPQVFQVLALCSLALILGLSYSLNRTSSLDQFLTKMGSMNASAEYFYENTEYNRELL